ELAAQLGTNAVGSFEVAGWHGTGNQMRKGNGERGTGNGERGTGNGEASQLLFPVPRSLFPLLTLKRPRHFGAFETLDLVAWLDVVVLLDGDAAFHAVAHFVDQFLEA